MFHPNSGNLCTIKTATKHRDYHDRSAVLTNDNEDIDPSKFIFLGKIFKDAGYETGYFGKWHVAFDEKQKDIHGFDVI